MRGFKLANPADPASLKKFPAVFQVFAEVDLFDIRKAAFKLKKRLLCIFQAAAAQESCPVRRDLGTSVLRVQRILHSLVNEVTDCGNTVPE